MYILYFPLIPRFSFILFYTLLVLIINIIFYDINILNYSCYCQYHFS